MRPVRSGLRFTFSIAFDNLRVEELGALLYALKPVAVDDTWDETAQPVVHTIGMGKPYGLGTVTIAPSLTIDQRYSETGSPGRYAKLFEGKRWFQPRIQGITQKDCVKAYLDAIGSKFAAGDLRAHPSLLALQKMTRAHGVNAEYIPLGLAWRSRRVLPSATDVG
jgi:hypothetical protein